MRLFKGFRAKVENARKLSTSLPSRGDSRCHDDVDRKISGERTDLDLDPAGQILVVVVEHAEEFRVHDAAGGETSPVRAGLLHIDAADIAPAPELVEYLGT